jgi:hypothetical protein
MSALSSVDLESQLLVRMDVSKCQGASSVIKPEANPEAVHFVLHVMHVPGCMG